MRKIFILLLLIVVVGAYVWFYEIEGQDKSEARERKERVFALEKEDITWLKIKDLGTDYIFERVEGRWRMTAPVLTGADPSAVDGFLRTLTNAKKERSFGAPLTDMAQYGLQNPQIKVYARTASGQSDSLWLGSTSSVGSNVFVSRGDTLVIMVAQTLKTNAQKSLFGWRDKRVLHFNKAAVRTLRLENSYGNFEFSRNGSWKLVQPLATAAETDAVEEMLNKIDFGRIKEVVQENNNGLRRFGLNNPAFKITMNEGKTTHTLIFSEARDGVLYAHDVSRPHVFTLDSSFAEPFNKSLFDLREKSLVSFQADEISRGNVLYRGNLVQMQKDNSGNWQTLDNDALDKAKVTKLLTALSGLEVDAFIAEDTDYTFPYGLTTPLGAIELFSGDAKIVELEVGKTENGRIYLRRPESGQIVAVDESKMEDILVEKEQLLEKREGDN